MTTAADTPTEAVTAAVGEVLYRLDVLRRTQPGADVAPLLAPLVNFASGSGPVTTTTPAEARASAAALVEAAEWLEAQAPA